MLSVALRRLVVAATLGLVAVLPTSARANSQKCCSGCPKGPCPSFVHCTPRPPKLKFKGICSKPVCDPCTLENYGYYPTCWSKFPGAPNYSHCQTPPPNTFFPEYTGHSAPIAGPTHLTPIPAPHPVYPR